MCKLFISLILSLFLPAAAFCLESHFELYKDFYKKYPEQLGIIGSKEEGEIEIVQDREKIDLIRQERYDKLREGGVSPDLADRWTRVGVIGHDSYWVWIRDAVVWPGGREGLYNRILFRGVFEGKRAAAVFPVTKEGKIGLILTFRHATRSWELELPRGGTQDKTSLEAAKTELKEEMGLEGEEWILLGEMAPDSGVMSTVVPVYLAVVSPKGKHKELYEAIDSTHFLTVDEINEGLSKGYLEIGKKRAFLRDPFLTYALYMSKIKLAEK